MHVISTTQATINMDWALLSLGFVATCILAILIRELMR